MKVVIAGGGTGGHLYPGIAVARELLATEGNEVLFVGTRGGIEARILPREGLPVRFITAGKLKGMGAASVLRTLFSLPRGLVQSAVLLREERPDVVIGVGGYASGPLALAAWVLRIPIVIVEPNSRPGLANRVLGKLARSIVLSFPGTNRLGLFDGRKVVETGPLVRAGIDRGDREGTIAGHGLDAGRFTVLVMGGSGGAHAINMAMKEAAPALATAPGVQVLHQAGERDVAEVQEAYDRAGVRARTVPYLHDMAGAYAAADLVICRAGATTVAELAVCGKRAVLIPFPFAADNHQEHNARTLAAAGGAEVIIQKDLRPDVLARIIEREQAGRPAARPRMAAAAAREIVRICTRYVQTD